jgi:fatty acid desaturase
MSPGMLAGGLRRGSKGKGGSQKVDVAQRAAKIATTTKVVIINPILMFLFILFFNLFYSFFYFFQIFFTISSNKA